MKLLIKNEAMRYFKKKSLWGLYLSIPLMVALMVSQAVKANEIVSVEKVATFHTFALYVPLHKIFTFYLFAIPVIMTGMSIASEYENSEIRMILIRGYSTRQVYLVKLLILLLSLFLFIVAYLICSYIIGFIMFPKENQIISFLSHEALNPTQCLLLTVKYYIAVLLILSVFTLGISLLAIMVCSVVTTTVFGMLFILGGFGFYLILQVIQPYLFSLDVSLFSLWSLPMMQLKGIYSMITGHQEMLRESVIVLSVYLSVFLGLSYYLTGKQDQFI